ncbi:hypothetical protein AVEN_183995-1 [Araneus ventricosus]|uniref:Uncharacterized protein n=1 Tax=Araneus ventricosus TaxID=182803 RepID=A0A4Y2E0U4_ARAVE|nr:hypothetical protein AVEN_183995-1 [Araneus ventricosus]
MLVCRQPLNGDSITRTRSLLGTLGGSSPNRCNPNFTEPENYFLVVMQSLKTMIIFLLMYGIKKVCKDQQLVVPELQKSSMSFSFGSLCFKDSFQFPQALP